MEEICRGKTERYWLIARAQDKIGWHRLMEGMISKRLVCLYAEHRELTWEGISTKKWASQLVIRLLKVTNGQWVYQNIQVYDEAC